MNHSKTKQGVIDLLSNAKGFMDGESIFLKLNSTQKQYSYAAVYNAIRELYAIDVIQCMQLENERKKYYALAKTANE